MKKNTFRIMVVFVALSFMAGLASIAVAQNASGDDADSEQSTTLQRRGEARGMAKFHRSGKGLGKESLTDEQIEKIKEIKSEFQTATRDLRMELQSKKLALQSELVKKEPDTKTAKALQKEISSLTAELAMKRLEHALEMKEIAPYGGMGQLKRNTEGVSAGQGRNT
jgi:Spy/CpxP family protein refolding chaperone